MKHVLITGGSSGIGLAAAEQFLNQGIKVILVARDVTKLQKARDDLEKKVGSKNIDIYSVDLADFGAIRDFADRYKQEYESLEVLALNAGLYTGAKYRMGASGYELMIASTHLGHFLLVHELMQMLERSKSRIVVTSSLGHRVGGLDIGSFTKPKYAAFPYIGPLWGYGQAKLANILFTREFAKRFSDKGIVINCFHPGAVDTGFTRHIPKLFANMATAFLIKPETAAKTLLYLSDDNLRVSGEYFFAKKVASTSKKAKDDDLALKLWEASEEMVGISA